MIISLIVIYLIGVFGAFLCVRSWNDDYEKHDLKSYTYGFRVIFLSWIIIFTFILTFIQENSISLPEPSLKKFISIFCKKKAKYEE